MNAITTRMKRISKTDGSAVIPPSHKWTEVGVLPKDWSVRSLRSCLLSVPSYGINEAAVPFDDDLPTYLRITDISKDGQFRPSPRVSVKHPSGQAFFLNEGDLVLARTGASVGKSYLYNSKDGPLVFAGFLIRISPNPEKVQPTFLAYCLQSKYYWNWVATMSIRSGQPGINGQEYGELQLPLPPLIEQRAIAEALSDVDGLINALEVLIAKNQAIKQAVMQQLLTGKTRLPGFSGAWETKRLGEIADCLDNVRIPLNETQRAIMPGPYPYCGANGVLDYVNDYVLDDDVVLIAEDGGYFDEFLTRPIAYRMSGKIWVNNHAHVLKAKSDYDQGFLYYSLVHKNIMPYLSGGTRAKLNKFEMYKIEINVPDDTDEQRAIASVLSDMDSEIAALAQRRDKTRAIKQGMMQQLLTGRVRLLKSEPSPSGATCL